MSKLVKIIVCVGLLAAGLWLWTVLFPNPQQVIRNRLNALARLASFPPNEGNIAHVAKIQRLGLFFTDDVQVMVDVPGMESHTFTSRAELMQMAAAARQMASGLKAELLDINIEMGTGAESALVDATLKAKISGEGELIVQELKFTFKKIKGDWLITRIETVKTLKP